ncbi:hypothetical protein [Crossiella sp. CA198]|uniref:hypothetical protein n=1 Tax=Crossiella sp. CA198 TaxID=3455607 RepID=UPI003F8D5B2E
MPPCPATTAYTAFPWMLAVLTLLSYVLLARAFRSLLPPLKAILLNLLSLGAVLGAMVLLWQWGWGTEELLGLRPDGAIGTFVPVTVFALTWRCPRPWPCWAAGTGGCCPGRPGCSGYRLKILAGKWSIAIG